MNKTEKPIVLQVAAKAAIVNSSGEVLIVREASSGKNNTKVGLYGLVGGRLNPGESFIDGLKREIMEETGLQVEVGDPLYVGEWHPVIRGVEHQIIAVFVRCTSLNEDVQLSEEHDSYKWINPADRKNHKIVEPDCFVIDKLAHIFN